ncbi:MAG TPA: DUF5693 family protein [bacterium]|nr:DUF5693 family protein [bacterium]
MTFRTRLFWMVLAVGVAASAIVLWSRWRVESRYRTVEIVLDGPDWEALAVREGRHPAEVLAEARRRGATSVALYERTLRRLADRGDIVYVPGEELLADTLLATPGPHTSRFRVEGGPQRGTVYVAGAPARLGELAETFSGLLGGARVQRHSDVLVVRGQLKDLEEMGLGFTPEDVEVYRRLGLEPVLRLRSITSLTAEGLSSIGARLARVGSGYPIVFEAVEVLGFERLLPETAAMLRGVGARYGRIEVFSARRKQRGEDRLAREMRREVIRLFSLTPEELLVLPQAEARDKFVRAARERNIRLLYLRPFAPTAGIVGTETNLAFVEGLAADLRRVGLEPGRAIPLESVRVSPVLRALAALGALAAMGLGLLFLGRAVGVPVPERFVWVLIALGVVLTAGMAFAGPITLWLKLLALGTAATLPAVGIVQGLPRRAGSSPIRSGIRALWMASFLSVAGGVLVAALLTEWEFMMAADVFFGVKIAQLLPVLFVALFVWRYDRPARSWRATVRELWAWSAHPLLMRYAVGVIVAGLAAVILLARSGNFGLPLLGIEDRLRTVLEDLLVARPRTKEYLIGHPALVLAGAAIAAGWRAWVLPLAAVAAVGQAGIVNSFSHIHTPLLQTVWRTVNALWLGTLLGVLGAAVVFAIARRTASRRPRPRGP